MGPDLPPPVAPSAPPNPVDASKQSREATWMILGGGALAVVSAFLPWYSVGPFTVDGTAGDGQISLAFGVVLGATGIARYKGSGGKAATWLAIISAALITAIGMYHYLTAEDGVSVGIGVYGTAAAGIFGFAGAMIGRTSPPVAMTAHASSPPGWHKRSTRQIEREP